MAKDMVKGEKVKLSAIQAGPSLEVAISCSLGLSAPDVSCFGVDAAGKLSDDRYFVFYNQRSSPNGEITALGGNSDYLERFAVSLDRLPPSIVRLVFVATIEGDGSFSSLTSGRMDLYSSGGAVATYAFSGRDFADEKAIIIGEVYLKGEWRAAAVGQGFNGGLPALLKHFGGEEIAPPPPAAASPTPPPPPAPVPAPKPSVNLSKVRLDKQGQNHRVSLDKGGSAQTIHINLQWDQPQAAGGFFGRLLSGGGGADLDLGCMWRDKSGNKGVIQPLGNSFGSKNGVPYIFLDKDDRSGSAADGENMRFYRPDTLDMVVIFAMIYEGTANFSNVNARLTIFDGRGGEILIPLNAPDPSRTFCAVAVITGGDDSIKVQKEERYFPSHRECDRQYGFGFNWVRGSKS